MANEKLTWLELRKAVAEYANTSEQEAEKFLDALLDSVIEGLKSDKQVKIKGLGVFSLKAVAPRKSVNIATGESFTIDGYNKLTFNAEAMLKESVEKRIDQPKIEAVMEELKNDPIKKLGEQANEIVDLLADLGQAPNVAEVPKVPEVTDTQDIPSTTQDPEIPEATSTPKMPVEQKKEDLPTTSGTTLPPVPPTPKKCHGLCWTIVAVLLALLIGAGVYFRETLEQWWQCMQDCQPIVEEIEEVEEIIEAEESQPVTVSLADKPREYVNFIGIERVGQDSRLAWIAYKYYAQKDLWVFIYEANRDIIKHPTHVRPGQYIRIPELSEEYRNLYNPELKQLVDSLAVEYLKQ